MGARPWPAWPGRWRPLGRPVDAARVLTAVPTGHPLRAEALTAGLPADGGRPCDAGRPGRRRAGAHTPPARGAGADAELAAALYSAALAALSRGEDVGPRSAAHPGTAGRAGHRAAEAALLELADATPDPARRHELLDAAARTRPWSLL